jgi:3-phosphoshikimate 1-carboxyvinyltransferase
VAAAPVLAVRGGRPLAGSVPLVGDKSISHRALLVGALADGPTRILNLSPCADVARTLEAVRALGVRVEPSSGTAVVVHGRGVSGLAGPPVRLDCGDSGTTMRLLAGLLAGQDRAFTLDGAPGLRRRPMQRVVDPLRSLGARIEATDGRPPLVGQGGGLHGAELTLAQASAQVASAVLLAALNAQGPTTIHLPSPVRDHTERMLAAFGVPLHRDGLATRLDGPVARLRPPVDGRLPVPEDPSAAAFLLVAATLVPGSSVRLAGVGINPGRTGLLDAMAAMGVPVDRSAAATALGEPVATLTAKAGRPRGTVVAGPLVARAIDELPLLAVLATQAEGRTELRDAAELRVKESDRIAAVCDGLGRLGAAIRPLPDGFVVDGPCRLVGTAVDGYDDHRVVMALAVAGLVAEGETAISGAHRVADSFPGFVAALAALGAEISA